MPGTFEIKKAKDGSDILPFEGREWSDHSCERDVQRQRRCLKRNRVSQEERADGEALFQADGAKRQLLGRPTTYRRCSRETCSRFTLKAANSQVIGNSQMYESEKSREDGIDSVMKNAPAAKLVEVAST